MCGHTAGNSSWVCQWTRRDGSYLHDGAGWEQLVCECMCVCIGGWRWEGGLWGLAESGLKTPETLSLPHRVLASDWKWLFLFLSPSLLFFSHSASRSFTVLASLLSLPSLSALLCQCVVTSLNGKSIFSFLPPPPDILRIYVDSFRGSYFTNTTEAALSSAQLQQARTFNQVHQQHLSDL